jgi:D-amino peptidase
VKVFLSCDMEGTAGVVDWSQAVGPGTEYEAGRALMLDEVNAAIDGALAAGATEIVVNDSHWRMANLPPAALHGQASYISGRHKPLYMMQGLDGSFDAVFFLAYHGSQGADGAVLSHTYNPRAVSEVRLDGRVVGESGINALVARHHGVPVALVTGDRTTALEAVPLCKGVETVVVKDAITRFAAHSLHPEVARARIREGAERALRRLGEMDPPEIGSPARLEVALLTPDFAELATWVRGVERTGPRAVSMRDHDHLRLFRTFITVVYLTRSLTEQ